VVIRLEEQLPVARWGDEALLNNQGQAFTPRELANYEHLPQLFGPQRAQQQVMQQYQVLSQMLRPLGFSIARLELRERGSWFLTTGAGSSGPGIELLLGRDHLVEKMRRFIAIYDKTLKDQITNIARIDLRYANGLAVGWREPAPDDGPTRRREELREAGPMANVQSGKMIVGLDIGTSKVVALVGESRKTARWKSSVSVLIRPAA
jgi:cell division septal protein FtsQ